MWKALQHRMCKMSLYQLILLLISLISVSNGLQCYNCSDIGNIEDCLTVTDCRSGQSCYMDRSASGQTSTLGCTENLRCGVSANGAGSLVGRDLEKRQVQNCHECCSTDKCNTNLCVHLKPGACIDDVKADCAWLNTMFNICQDVQHAKSVCPKFCALCSLVDGNWAAWTTWSQCDVTCESGSQTRTRTCTNPAPASGGLDCIGSSTDTKACLKELCPVHGGWTKWSDWQECSVTCGVGFQKRHRNCSNPVPARYGQHCFGDTLDVQRCSRKSCDIGNIAFMAYNIKDVSPSSGQTMIFGNVRVNEGHAYNTSTGIFTAPVSGTYSFSTQLCVPRQIHLYVAIVVDGVTYATILMYDQDYDDCDTAVTVALLHANAKVLVRCSTGPSGDIILQDGTYRVNSFSGYLIHE